MERVGAPRGPEWPALAPEQAPGRGLRLRGGWSWPFAEWFLGDSDARFGASESLSPVVLGGAAVDGARLPKLWGGACCSLAPAYDHLSYGWPWKGARGRREAALRGYCYFVVVVRPNSFSNIVAFADT